ncbi:STOREKEEPER protein-like [Punica granatum]|uniref:Glabrous enhancer-binding protein-like DBD domain-containing protein n=2 Tax=Punica granatum TaxID=22663 RepID=A0A218XCX1_PUNGR|nr:STOREKEEPER protein-like [Punica granatum]OWM82784.1 hypothetical protein CDL15_Pgr008665 [Punica granatum]PKI61614.1 hypothetical protein CRG98_017989 [Punica granatum]
MAPKRPAPADKQPPPAVSTDEESSESAGSEEEEEEEDDESYDSDEPRGFQQKAPQPKPSSAPPPRAQTKPQKPVSSSEPESESESDESKGNLAESDSESDCDVTHVAAAKPVEGEGTPKSKKLILKRPAAEDAATTHSKKSNAASRSSRNPGEEGSSKKTPFQRVWSDEDEIAFLEGMIEFWEKRGVDPKLDINSFHEFIKGRLHLAVVPAQLANKIRTCKRKFKNNQARAMNGKGVRPNDRRAYELSRRLWDSEEGIIGENSVPKATKKRKTSTATVVPMKVKGKDKMAETWHNDASPMSLCEAELSRILDGHLNGSSLRRGLEHMSDSRKEKMEEEWEKLQLAELQVQANRALMIHEHANLIINAYKK